MINLSKTILLLILLAVFVIAAGVFVYQWWQTKEEFPEGGPEKEAVTITTNKTEYEQGEIIKITIKNGLDKAIFGGYCLEVFGLWGIERFKENGYEEIYLWFPIVNEGEEFCTSFSPEIPLAIKRWEPYSEVHQEWNQEFCGDNTVELLEKGKYRLIFTYGLECEFKAYEEPCACGKIKDPKTIYSNEFIIK